MSCHSRHVPYCQALHPRHAVVFQHIPWFINEEGETDTGYFALSPENRQKWMPRMKDAHVSKMFCGHYHRNAGGYTDDMKMEVVITSAVGRQMSEREIAGNCMMEDPSTVLAGSGLRIVRVGDDAIHHSYREFEEMEVEHGVPLPTSSDARSIRRIKSSWAAVSLPDDEQRAIRYHKSAPASLGALSEVGTI